MTPAQEYRLGVRAADSQEDVFAQLEQADREVRFAVALLLGLVLLSCFFGSLSGCLTVGKIHLWETALVGWARKGNQECVEAVKPASTYLVNANQRLQGATSALDLAPDGEAKKLMTEAAQKCGERVP